MTKQIITSIAVLVAALVMPASVSAQYGQQVLGEKTEEVVVIHETVDTAISDYVNPATVGMFFIGASGVFYMISKKAKISASKELIS